ncbi:MAG: WecB/TagA/CpsF family glycosyltransferase [Patescibacteria group bacterium]|nr:WecB/TagA/CpsF family glycosyltransferase [Patescibacteria group bacterium]MCL5432291.1 WecB/TagA/CpsF family glycosyltransferase [Patescibacteria group bacterium]
MTKKILGIKIDDYPKNEVLGIISSWLIGKSKKQRLIVTVGPEFLVTAQKDLAFKEILDNTDLSLPEGIGLRLFGKIKHRLPGRELMLDLCRLAAKKNWTVGLYGAAAGVAEKTADRLCQLFPGIKIVSQNPDLFFVALGHPKQEKFLWDCKLKVVNCKFRVGMGVGGAFDYISGTKPLPPEWLAKLGLEWVWRLVREHNRPNHVKRIINATIIFPLLLLQEKLVFWK